MVNQANLPDCQLLFATVDRIKNGSGGESTVLLLCPDERTSRDAVTESVLCHERKLVIRTNGLAELPPLDDAA
jgi:hypothetical protein